MLVFGVMLGSKDEVLQCIRIILTYKSGKIIGSKHEEGKFSGVVFSRVCACIESERRSRAVYDFTHAHWSSPLSEHLPTLHCIVWSYDALSTRHQSLFSIILTYTSGKISFLKMHIRIGSKHEKGKNKGSLHS